MTPVVTLSPFVPMKNTFLERNVLLTYISSKFYATEV